MQTQNPLIMSDVARLQELASIVCEIDHASHDPRQVSQLVDAAHLEIEIMLGPHAHLVYAPENDGRKACER